MKCSKEADRPVSGAVIIGHDWVLVSRGSAEEVVHADSGLLWACPCGEFRWTSYAKWEARPKPEQQRPGGNVTQGLPGPGQNFDLSKIAGEP